MYTCVLQLLELKSLLLLDIAKYFIRMAGILFITFIILSACENGYDKALNLYQSFFFMNLFLIFLLMQCIRRNIYREHPIMRFM